MREEIKTDTDKKTQRRDTKRMFKREADRDRRRVRQTETDRDREIRTSVREKQITIEITYPETYDNTIVSNTQPYIDFNISVLIFTITKFVPCIAFYREVLCYKYRYYVSRYHVLPLCGVQLMGPLHEPESVHKFYRKSVIVIRWR